MQYQPLPGELKMELGSVTYTDDFDGKYSDSENVTQNFSYYLDGDWEDSIWENVIEDFKKSQLTLDEPTTIVLLIFYVPIFLTSLVGNILVLRVIVPNQRMWTVTNNFLVNLAVADLLVTVLCMPMTMLGKVYKLWIYGEVMCKLTPYLQGVSVTSSTFTITAMSLDRCLAILHPVKFRNLRTKRNVRTLLAVIWFTSALLMIPLLIVNKTKSQKIFTNFMLITCTEAWDSVVQRRAYDFSLLFIICLGPAQIVFVSYVLMGKRLWSTDSRLDAHCENKKDSNRAKSGSVKGSFNAIRASRRKTAKMCIVVSVVFVICWLPYYTVNIYLDFKRDHDALDIVYWGLLIGHLHCITNPILYCFMHKAFRYCVKRMLPCWRNEFVRQPSCYGTNGYGGRMSSLMTSTRSKRSSTYKATEKQHARLSNSSSSNASSSKVASSNNQENQEDDQIIINCNTSNNGVNPRKVKMIFKRLRHKELCKKASNNSVKSVEIPESIIEEVKSSTKPCNI